MVSLGSIYIIMLVSNDYANIVVRVEDIVHDPKGHWHSYWHMAVIANTTLLLLL